MRDLSTKSVVFLVGCAALMVCAPVGGEAGKSGEEDDLIHLYHFPPDDPGAGALLKDAADLLEAARKLPPRVDLWEGRPAQKPDNRGKETQPGWVTIDDDPVVPLHKLATTYFEGEKYRKAAACYRRLHHRNPDNSHYATMQVLCNRLAGDSSQEGTVQEVKSKVDGANAEWIEWTEKMDSLHNSLGNGGAK